MEIFFLPPSLSLSLFVHFLELEMKWMQQQQQRKAASHNEGARVRTKSRGKMFMYPMIMYTHKKINHALMVHYVPSTAYGYFYKIVSTIRCVLMWSVRARKSFSIHFMTWQQYIWKIPNGVIGYDN